MGYEERMEKAGARRLAWLQEMESVQAECDLAVNLARAEGMSWSWVGQVFGMSKQAAQQRWGDRREDQVLGEPLF